MEKSLLLADCSGGVLILFLKLCTTFLKFEFIQFLLANGSVLFFFTQLRRLHLSFSEHTSSPSKFVFLRQMSCHIQKRVGNVKRSVFYLVCLGLSTGSS